MAKLSQDMRDHFTAWLGDRPDDVILRKVFALMLAGTVTVLALDYLELSGLRENQYIEIYNINNGERFTTYIIEAPRGSGEITLNGAAARRAMVGDLLIIAAYSTYSEAELANYRPVVVLLDEHNRPKPMSVNKQAAT